MRCFLEDTDIRVRVKAIHALYKYDPDRAIDEIKAMTMSSDKYTRLYAVDIIRQIADSRVIKLLMDMDIDPESEVQRAVFRSLNEILNTETRAKLSETDSERIQVILEHAAKSWVIH